MPWSTKFSRKSARTPRRGAILVATLGLIILMTFLVIEFLTLSTAEVKRLSLRADQDELRTYAYSSLDITRAVLAELNEVEKKLRSPAQGWGNPLAYAEGISFPEDIKSTIIVEDETGKVPLNINTDPKLLNAFFEKLGLDSSQANTLTDSLLDWIDPDDNARLNGAESSYYDRKTPSYKPTGQPITDFSELLYIQGFDEYFFDEDGKTDERFEALKENATLVGEGPINVNTAPPLVLELLGDEYGLDATTLKEKRKQFAEGNATLKDVLITSNKDLDLPKQKTPAKTPYGFESKTFKITIETCHGDNRFQLTSLIGAVPQQKQQKPSSAPPGSQTGKTPPPPKTSTKNQNFTILRLVENAPLN